MAIISATTWGRVQRPWGYEARVDFVDDTGQRYARELAFRSEPDEATLAAAVTAAQARLEWELTPPAPEYHIVCEDGTAVDL